METGCEFVAAEPQTGVGRMAGAGKYLHKLSIPSAEKPSHDLTASLQAYSFIPLILPSKYLRSVYLSDSSPQPQPQPHVLHL